MKAFTVAFLLVLSAGSVALGQGLTIDWASFSVEREAFFEATPGKYGTAGTCDGIGLMYFSPTKKLIEFKGLCAIEIPHMGQEADDKHELKFESFTITAMVPTGRTEYAFQARSTGPFSRTITGKIRFAFTKSGVGRVESFQMAEHGQTIKGVMNRYHLPKSMDAKAMFRKYENIFFGGNYVSLGLAK